MIEGPVFTCVICQRHINGLWPGPFRMWSIPPVCRYCEGVWGKEPGSGSFRDRRMAAQILALSTKLDCEAFCKENPIYGTS
jgi:hypothetical protein